MKKGQEFETPVVLGFDAAGIVESVGSEVRRFKVGDEVYYSGNPYRPGSFQQYQLVDERIVGHKPAKLSFEQAAALPLTSLTAWEAMHEVQHSARKMRALTQQAAQPLTVVCTRRCATDYGHRAGEQ